MGVPENLVTPEEPRAESDEQSLQAEFVCQCEPGFRLACKGLAFFKELKGKRYCVLHYPANDKMKEFEGALGAKVAKKNFDLRGVWFPGPLNFSNFEFSAPANFGFATFSTATDFRSAAFGARASFEQATFNGIADFSSATFTVDAYFSSATFSADSKFTSVMFGGDGHFRGTTFSGACSFGSAKFSDGANFYKAEFRSFSSFRSATFRRDVEFGYAAFGADADFIHANFEAESDFSHAAFSGDVNFGHAGFDSAVDFDSAEFTAEADFAYSRFGTTANFSKAAFAGEADFDHTAFEAAADFRDATFGGKADFDHATFGSSADFDSATFSGLADFRFATFKVDASFLSVTFSRGLSFHSANLDGYVRFAGDKSNLLFSPESALSLQYARVKSPECISFHTVLLRPHWFINIDPRKFEFINVEWHAQTMTGLVTASMKAALLGTGFNTTAAMAGLAEEIQALQAKAVVSPHQLLSTACRNLAVNAEDNNRYEEASTFRYMAMEALRRARSRGFAFWSLNWWYWLACGYGERWRLAAGWLIGIVFVVFPILYTQVGFETSKPTSVLFQPLPGAANPNSSEPVASAQDRAQVDEWMPFARAITYSLETVTFQKPDPRPATFAAHLTVSFELLFGPLQAALLALAIRRKFMR